MVSVVRTTADPGTCIPGETGERHHFLVGLDDKAEAVLEQLGAESPAEALGSLLKAALEAPDSGALRNKTL